MAEVENLSGLVAGDVAGNSEEDLVYCTKVFGLCTEDSGKPAKIIKQGSDTIRFFFDKNNSGSVENEIQG
jgi:hypothetical protein